MTTELYGYDEISKKTGVPIGTLRAWKARGKMPGPDFVVQTGRPVPGWLPGTIEPWIAQLTGRPLPLHARPVQE